MAHIVADRACETTTTTGTGNLTLAGAVAGFQTFANAGCADNDTFHYVIEAVDGGGVPTGDWEIGLGTYVSATPAIARTQVLQSSNADAAVSFGAVTKRVFITRPAPTAPSVISVGAEFSSTGVPTATLPGTHATNDVLILCIQQSNETNYAAPTGYTRAGPQNGIGAAATAGSTKLCIFWKRDGGSESAPTLTDSGDHTYGVMFAVRGCPLLGDPFHILGNAFKLTSSTTGTSPKGVSCIGNCLIVDIFAHAIDNAAAQGSSPTNTDLASVTEQFDDGTTDGTGGGIYVMSGVKKNNGPIAASTVTWGSSTVDVSTRLAFLPMTYQTENVPRSVEVQTFIGSTADLDDLWVKPSAAVTVFAQICDGGGGGSGGNTTTTAAGGGGGGGGGYDECWFAADSLAATITVHAGRGAAAGTALNQAGNLGTVSEFDKGGAGPLIAALRNTGTAATAAASADGGNGGGGGGIGATAANAAVTSRVHLNSLANTTARGKTGAPGGSGTTGPTGGSEADWGGGGGESGADTDAATTAANNGNSNRGGGGGSSGRTNTNISQPGRGGGAASTFAAQGDTGALSSRLPYGGAGGVGGGSSVVTGGKGGFPGGGGGGGAGVAGGFGGAGGDGCVVVTTYFQ